MPCVHAYVQIVESVMIRVYMPHRLGRKRVAASCGQLTVNLHSAGKLTLVVAALEGHGEIVCDMRKANGALRQRPPAAVSRSQRHAKLFIPKRDIMPCSLFASALRGRGNTPLEADPTL